MRLINSASPDTLQEIASLNLLGDLLVVATISKIGVSYVTSLASIGLIGFREETEAPWRRGFGTFGAIISLFCLSLEFSSDDSIFRYITWMFIGIVAFGFGILYMNRLGEISTLYAIEQGGQVAPTEVSEDTGKALAEIDEGPDVIDIDASE